MSVIILSWVDKGTCEHNPVYWHQVSLHQAGVGWGFGTVIFKVHPLMKNFSHPIPPVLKKKKEKKKGKCTSVTLSNYTVQKKNSQQQSRLPHYLFKVVCWLEMLFRVNNLLFTTNFVIVKFVTRSAGALVDTTTSTRLRNVGRSVCSDRFVYSLHSQSRSEAPITVSAAARRHGRSFFINSFVL